MGDRFYHQQIQATGTCPGDPKAKPKRRTKADVLEELGYPCLAKLTKADLEELLLNSEVVHLNMQEGTLKLPYILECKKVNENVAWNKLTIAELKEFIKSFA